MKKILIIQTAFIGDVILATSLLEKTKKLFPDAQIDFLLRKGCESLLFEHPFINKLWILEKKKNKYHALCRMIKEIRAVRYDMIINAHRFGSSGLITALSGAAKKIGFNKNPFSFTYSVKVKHEFGNATKPLHETERNLKLLDFTGNSEYVKPRLHLSPSHHASVAEYVSTEFICIAPASLWFTKQYPEEKWIDFISKISSHYNVFLLGSADDHAFCKRIATKSNNTNVQNLAGTLGLLETAALLSKAKMTFVNDSAVMHIASATNAPVTAIYCSTIPEFGFGPLSDNSHIVQTQKHLECRPCGLHGYKNCPKKHFKCAFSIDTDVLLKKII